MLLTKRGQIATEYLIIISFVTFIIISVMGVALIYSSEIRDSIKSSQLDKLSDKIVSTSESVFYAGEPSKIEIQVYLPESVNNITISGKDLRFKFTNSNGESVRVYTSKVPLQGSISIHSGVKNLLISANQSWVDIHEVVS